VETLSRLWGPTRKRFSKPEKDAAMFQKQGIEYWLGKVREVLAKL
jgi:hypothetical protein